MDFSFLPFPDWPAFALFLSAVLVLNLTPGPELLLILSQSVEGGRRVGLYAAFGIASAGFVQIIMTVVGVTLILSHSKSALLLLNAVGCGYLIYIGVKMILATKNNTAITQVDAAPVQHAFRHGFFVNLLNPQVSLFFLAFIPQFVNTEIGSVWLQIMLLGLILKASGLIVNCSAALMFWRMSSFLSEYGVFLRYKGYVSGTVLLVIAAVFVSSAIK